VERLYSPWRLAYVTGAAEPRPDCIFCHACDGDETEGLVVARGTSAYIVLNLYPYNSGHLMVVPRRHVSTLSALSLDEVTEMMRLTQRAERVLTEVYQPQGLNVGINVGKAAGAGVADHLHLHMVPRWAGDTNFMSVVGDVRVLPEEITVSAARLRAAFEKLTIDD
jgi:ATP adenylyltransferase